MKHIFCHRDADGFYSALVYVNNEKSNDFIVRSVQYKEEISFDCVAPNEPVVFLDFTPQLEDVKRLFAIEGVTLAIFDHHPVMALHDEILKYAAAEFLNIQSFLDVKANGCVGLILVLQGSGPFLDGNVLAHIGMRDIWHFEPDTEAVCRGAQALAPLPVYDHEFANWATTVRNLTLNRCLEVGKIFVGEMIAEIWKDLRGVREWEIWDHEKAVLMVHGCFSNKNISELGDEIAKQHGLGAVFMIIGDRLQLSFRGNGARGAALLFGGGGHANAAGASSQNWVIEPERIILK